MTTSTAAPVLDIPSIAKLTGGPAPREDNKEDLGLMHAPDPVGHFMLVALPTMNDRTESGIWIPPTVNDRERAASVVGTVLAMGPDCYIDPEPKLPETTAPVTVVVARPRFPSGPWCKIGDTVLFSRYAGKRFTIEGTEFRMLADDEITATVPAGARVGGL